MATTRTTHHHDPLPFFDTAVRVASHYGFSPLEQLVAAQTGKRRTLKPQQPLAQFRRGLDDLSSEFLTAMKTCAENRLVSESKPPVLIYFSNAAGPVSKRPKTLNFGIGVIGSRKSVSEALLLRTALSILEELGIDDSCVHINSMGDRDSLARLSKELTNYFRKNISLLPPQGQQALKRDVLSALEYIHQKEHELCQGAPRPMEYLTEESRRHLREIIEFLERSGARYEIDETLMGNRDCHSQTLFELRATSLMNADSDTDDACPAREVVARGGRFDELPRKLFRMEIPAASVLFSVQPKRASLAKTLAYRPKKPQVFFVQLGFEAKLQSLPLLDALRKARIEVDQFLESDRLGEQLERAEELAVPYTIIMGHKEVLEHSVLVRNMDNRSQETVPIEELPSYLRARLAGAKALV